MEEERGWRRETEARGWVFCAQCAYWDALYFTGSGEPLKHLKQGINIIRLEFRKMEMKGLRQD